MTNRPTLPALDVRWLTDPAATGELELSALAATQALQRTDYPIPPKIGHAWSERLPLAHGLSLYQAVHRFRPEARGQQIALGEFSYRFPEPALVIQTVQGGTIRHQEFDPPADLIYRPGVDFFRRAETFRFIPWIETATDSTMTALVLTEAVLAHLIGEDLATALIARLGLETPPVVKVRHIPVRVSVPLRAALAPQLQGTLQQLFAHSRVLEYLCALCADTTPDNLQAPRFTDRLDRLQELHYELTHLEVQLPKLEDLAVRFGMSARRLNDAFAARYGLPIFAFMADWRLNEAHVAIRDSEVALKVLASRLGYSHVNHFNRAFKRKFGYPPGSLRRGRREVDDEAGTDAG
jgi:AraC-like DNA-binding protein